MRGISRLAVVAALMAAPAGAETVKLTLLGVGDVYNFEEEDGRGGFARLNVKHGPNLAQLVSDLPAEGGAVVVEFDLAHARIDDTRIERAWLDLIFNDMAMTGIALRDLVVSRRPRAEL